jgi:ribose-phosphate pyrophosphokinase
LIMDDEIDTGGTIMAAANIAFERGAKSVTVACVHPILSRNAVDRICSSDIDELVVTDTIPLPPEKMHSKITALTLAPLLGEAITRTSSGRSVGELFQ